MPFQYFLRALLLFALTHQVGYSQYQSADEQNKTQAVELRKKRISTAEKYISKSYWYKPNENAIARIELYDEIPPHRSSQTNRFFPTSTVKFTIDEVRLVERYPDNPDLDEIYLKVIFPGEKIGYIPLEELIENIAKGPRYNFQEYIFSRPPDEFARIERQQAAQQKAKGGVRIGMTKEQVLASNWGRPRTVNSTITNGGKREQWVYEGGYLYFQNGVVYAIQN